jgi:hypothetical protein
LKDSPIVGLIPYASQAVNLSTAAVNVAYAAGVQDKKVNFDKIKEFEKELQRYTGFYNALDKANLTNATSSSQTVTLLETLQLDVLEKFKKDGQKIGFNPREIRGDETIDDYFNYVMGEFTPELMRKKTTEIEKNIQEKMAK